MTVKCCRTCSYFHYNRCLKNIMTISDENNLDSVVDYVIGDGILAEALEETLEEKVKPLYKGNDYEDFRLSLIEDIECIVRSKIYSDQYAQDLELNVDITTFYCSKYE